MQNLSPVRYIRKNTTLDEVICRSAGSPYFVSVCHGPDEVNLTCTGDVIGKYKYNCQTNESFPVCMMMTSSGKWNTSACKSVGFDFYSTRCVCHLNPSSNIQKYVLMYYAVKFHVENYNFTSYFMNQNLPLRDSGKPVFIIFIFFGSIEIILIWVYQFSYTRTKKETDDEVPEIKRKYYSINWYFEQCLPIEFSRDSSFERFGKLLRKYHGIAALELPVDDKKRRKMAKVFTEILCRWFFITFLSFLVLSQLLLLDDGTCENRTTISDCNMDKFNGFQICHWIQESEICIYEPREVSIIDLIYLIAIVTTIASPFMSLNDYAFQCFEILSSSEMESSLEGGTSINILKLFKLDNLMYLSHSMVQI
jgi:hypothetical protein